MPPRRTTSPTTTSTEAPHADNEIYNQVNRGRTRLRYTSTSTTTPSPYPESTPGSSQATVPFFRKRTRPAVLAGTTTTTATTTTARQVTSRPTLVVRRKLFRTSAGTLPPTTVAPSATLIESECRCSRNACTFLSTNHCPSDLATPFTASATPSILNSINDQELGSSITQENKFHNNRFNQIGESDVDVDFGAAIQAISKAPLPVLVPTTTKYRQKNQFTLSSANRGISSPPADAFIREIPSTTTTTTGRSISISTTTTNNFPANHKRLKIKKIAASECTPPDRRQSLRDCYMANKLTFSNCTHSPGLPASQNVPEFVTGTASAASATTERHYNKPILIMTSDRPTNRQHPKPFERVNPKGNSAFHGQLPVGATDEGVSERPHFDYDYYDENDDQFIGKIRAQVSEWLVAEETL